MTLVVTMLLVGACFLIKRHYKLVVRGLRQLDEELPSPPEVEQSAPSSGFVAGQTSGLLEHHSANAPDPTKPVAILMVGGYSGLGRHALLTLLRMFPQHFERVVFVSVAVVDSESFKGANEVAAIERRTRESLVLYERYAETLGVRSTSALAMGTEVPMEAEKIAGDLVCR